MYMYIYPVLHMEHFTGRGGGEGERERERNYGGMTETDIQSGLNTTTCAFYLCSKLIYRLVALHTWQLLCMWANNIKLHPVVLGVSGCGIATMLTGSMLVDMYRTVYVDAG